MTSRERNLAILHGEVPDCVPCAPDISNMVPARLTGRPFYHIYAYQDPPLWKAHIEALKLFDIDGGFELYSHSWAVMDPPTGTSDREERIVKRNSDGSFATRGFQLSSGRWDRFCTAYPADNPPFGRCRPESLGVPEVPSEWEPLTGVKQWPVGDELWQLIRREMGDQGIVGLYIGASTCVLGCEDDVYAYYDNPEPFRERSRQMVRTIEQRMEQVAAMRPRPDVVFCGGSGSLIWQTPAIFRELALPPLRRVTEMAADLGLPTHVHSCGPEAAMVRMAAEETKLTIIDPLEIAPMGDCNLAELKRLYGRRIALKGNLHTTGVMLHGSADDVRAASRQAIDDAAAGGGFILSTGDQCGRDTPDENLRAMIETARTYGRY